MATSRKTSSKNPDAKTFVGLLGGPSEVARIIEAADKTGQTKMTRQSVHGWKQVPAAHVRLIARKLRLKPANIRPDIFGNG